MSPRNAQVEPYDGADGKDGLLVRTPYHEGFVAELKALPWKDRAWLPDTGWWVAAAHEDVIGHLLLQYFGGFERIDAGTGEVEYVDSSGAVARQGRLL